MARDFEPSASQQRAADLFKLTFDGTHAGAKAVLMAAGLTENGIPNGLTPAKAKKLSDDELRAAFGVEVADAATVSDTGAASVQAIREEREARRNGFLRFQRQRRDDMNAYAASKISEVAPFHSDEDVREEMYDTELARQGSSYREPEGLPGDDL